MMNVLTDILCDTSSMMTPQSFKGALSQNKISQHDISSKQGSLHILDSVSHISGMDRPLSTVNHSSPSNINIFNSSSQIHMNSNMDSGFPERSDVSVFSDSFPEIVPSWLAHDFMKVSDNLPSPDILSNVSDIYSTHPENEHLEMLDLGFPPELTSQDNPNNLNRSCIDDNQKLLVELPMQRFSNSNSLIIPSFNDMSNTHLHISMNKNDIQYQKYKQNRHDVDSTRSLMNSVLPCENELLHLPLPSSLTEQCLNSSSSPSMISNSQSQSVVCDKLPQINLNHLDSLLGNDSALSEIQLLRHNYPTVRLAENAPNSHSNRACLNNYNPNGSLISCNAGNMLSSNLPPLPHVQDASVQVSFDMPTAHNRPVNINCFSCSEVGLESPIETIQCFKCKFCDYISIHKCAVASHIGISHSKISASTSISENSLTNVRSDNFNPAYIGGQTETRFSTTKDSLTVSVNMAPAINSSGNTNSMIPESEKCSVIGIDKYSCMQCNSFYSNVDEYNSHMFSIHNIKPVRSNQLDLAQNTLVGYQLISINNIVTVPSEDQKNPYKNTTIKNISKLPQNDLNRNTKRKILPKESDDDQYFFKKIPPKKSANENSSTNNEKNISSHKKAWQKKMRRELGTYICEFKGCNVRFRAIDNLEYHRKCHSIGPNAFTCPECGMNFENWGTLAGHLWRTHGNDMELHACDRCPFRTYSLSRLENIHKLIHGEECLFLCDTCGKSFKNGKQLRNHRVQHLKPKEKKSSFKCNTCSNMFKTKRLLLLHESSIHNKIKPYMCMHCKYSTGKKSSLDMHIRLHTGEKPFKCDECSYCSSDHNTLRRHKNKHSGDKPYKCPYCPYSCIQASRYKVHLKRHPDRNDGLMFSCNICSFKTIKRETYILHMCEHESENRPSGESSTAEIHSTHETFPLAEAMGISLSHSDNSSNFHNKNIQSFFNSFNVNMVSVDQESIN